MADLKRWAKLNRAMKTKYQVAKEKRLLEEKKRWEEDSNFFMLFEKNGWSKKDGLQERFFPRVPLIGNPHGDNPDVIPKGIADFQKAHCVSDWKEIASRYEFDSEWWG